MSSALSQRRMVENEAVFREMNKRAINYIDELGEIADNDKNKEYLRYDDSPLHFYCECADENCHERIAMKPSDFTEIHKKNDVFIVLPDHEVNMIEEIITKHKTYYIIKKYTEPPKSATMLQQTDIDNVITT
jgi:hypothetical protein